MEMHIRKNGFTEQEHETIIDALNHIETHIELAAHKTKSTILMWLLPWITGNTLAVLGVVLRIWH